MSKYRAVPTVIDGIRFASKKESARYLDLKLLWKAELIVHLELQVKFPIVVNEKKICVYIADFRYYDVEKKKTIIEDCKGLKTPVYRLKKKLFETIYEEKILET